MAKVTGTQLKQAIDDAVCTGGEWWRSNCPVCASRTGKEDLRRSFALRPEGYYLCHKCGVRGWSKTVKDSIGDEWAIDMMADGLDEVYRRQESSPECKKPPHSYVALGTNEGKTAISVAWARNYLIERGVPEDLWGPLQLGACASGFFAGRIIIPVMSADGDWNGFVARGALPGVEPKYLYPKGFNRASYFFNEPALNAKVGDNEPIIITEGVFDAIKLFPHAVACLGKPTKKQVTKLVQNEGDPIYACMLDADAQAEGQALQMKLTLMSKRAFYVPLPPGEDPGSMSLKKLRQLVDHANKYKFLQKVS